MIQLFTGLFLVALVGCRLPSSCQCETNTFECSLCLLSHFRQWTNGNFNCTDGYTEMVPEADKCRPKNCSTYTDSGCASCWTNWNLWMNPTTSHYVCVCAQNYELVDDNCLCRSKGQLAQGSTQLEYYEVKEKGLCLVCPTGCSCNATGCFNCSAESKRASVSLTLTTWCPCSNGYVQINGICGVYTGCQVTSDAMACNASSRRVKIVSNDSWECIPPYQDVGGSCECQLPYLLDIYKQNGTQMECGCQSRKLPASYYDFNGVCRACPTGCRCGNIGCQSCDSSVNRQIVGLSCPCKSPYVDVRGSCECMQPYYVNGLGLCVCLSQIYPAEYYYNPENGACVACPDGCTCSSSGCTQCQPIARRNVRSSTATLNGNTVQICSQCILDAEETSLGVCQCVVAVATSTDTTCPCTKSEIAYIDATNGGQCTLCPTGCTCSQAEGCHTCQASRHRVPILSSGTYKVCPCQQGYSQVNGVCICKCPYSINSNNICECTQPYTLSNGQCVCLSKINAQLYYEDTLNSTCSKCPAGCSCNSSGCVSCNQDALRNVMIYKGVYVCPCQQKAYLQDGQCKMCAVNHMVVNGICVRCEGCADCDVNGCTECSPNTYLSDGKCLCSNPQMVNINGRCGCPYSKYYSSGDASCKNCPKNCLTCAETAGSLPSCTSCRNSSTRINSVDNNCPCRSGYKEMSPAEAYCCPVRCMTCDSAGCLTCNGYANRLLRNGDCICKDGFTEMDNGVCGCGTGTTQYTDTCLTCPASCQNCTYNYTRQAIQCVKCNENAYRNVSSSSCSCLQGFQEASIQQPFCIPTYCLAFTEKGTCTQCVESRQMGPNNMSCICLDNYYDTGSYGLCRSCQTITGCISCTSATVCTLCDTKNGYSLVVEGSGSNMSAVCRKNMAPDEYLFTQASSGIYMQIKLDEVTASYKVVKMVQAYLHQSYSRMDELPVNNTATQLTVKSFRLMKPNILEVEIRNPPFSISSSLINVRFSIVNYTSRLMKEISSYDDNGPFVGVQEDRYVYRQNVYADSNVNYMASNFYILQNVIVGILMICSLLLYLRGYKHNHVVFYLQTMTFLGYTIEDPEYRVASLLHGFKISYLEFGISTNMVSIPDGYLQSSRGNFFFFVKDSNLLRCTNMVGLIAILTCATIVTFRIVWQLRELDCINRVRCIRNLSASTRKVIYRLLEYLYKICMYPLLFFSFMTFFNWSPLVLTPSPSFQLTNQVLCMILLIVYVGITLYQWFLETTANVSKVENVTEFASAALTSLILTVTIHHKTYLLITLVFIGRTVVYIVSRRGFLRDFFKTQYSKGAVTLLEVISIFVTLSGSPTAIFAMVVIVSIVQLVYGLSITILTDSLAQSNKAQGPVTEEKSDGNLEGYRQSAVLDDEKSFQQPNIEQEIEFE